MKRYAGKTLDELREMCEAATEGPWAWEYSSDQDNGYVVGLAFDYDGNQISGRVPDYDPNAMTDPVLRRGHEVGEHEAATCNYVDADFIATSRTALPALVERVKACEEELRLLSQMPCFVPTPGGCGICFSCRARALLADEED